MVSHFEGTLTGVFQEKKRGEYRSFPGKVPKRTDFEKIGLRFLCLLLFSIILYQNLEMILP